MRVVPWFVVLLLLLAGCLGQEGPVDAGSDEVDPVVAAQARSHVVVAGIDTGINPYNEAFRDDSPEAYLHPSVYIDGFPHDAVALKLTFDAESYEEAVMADCDLWRSVEPDTLYWFPGTRIIGGVTWNDDDVECKEDALPHRILDRGGHGTMIASRAVGATQGICHECKFVSVQGFSTASMLWAAEQGWIDIETNSWGTLPTDYAQKTADRSEARAAAMTIPTFVSAGNGIGGFFGGTGHPIWYDGNTGPEGIIAVGAHDGGQPTLWGATMPHVIADGIKSPGAHHDGFDGDEDTAGGTSGAAPFAAGTLARALLETRSAVNDTGNGPRDGALVVVPDPTPVPEEGPLSDGRLTLDETKRVFFHTADPRPERDEWYDGPDCDPATGDPSCVLYPSIPVPYSEIPEALPLYYYVGYGGVGNATWPHTLAVLLGEKADPERPMEDRFFDIDTEMRRAFDENQP